jgi:AraC family transcriptional regulator
MMSRLSDDLSLREVAAVTGLSSAHFSFAFKRSVGLAPYAWLRRQRIEKAKALLQDPELNLTEIAVASGYSNQSAFGVAFKRETCFTPSEWRQASRKSG